jgi:hypothetical protein
MKVAVVITVVTISCLLACSDDGIIESNSIPAETISPPNTPAGPTQINSGVMAAYTSGGATSNIGHDLEYRFQFGATDTSAWLPIPSASHVWPVGRSFVRCQARCIPDTLVTSNWSDSLFVTGKAEVVTRPWRPAGDTLLYVEQVGEYVTSSSQSTFMHPVKYRFDWGDGTQSEWVASGSATHSWLNTGTYIIKAQARCSIDTLIVSQWSYVLRVDIAAESISGPTAPVVDDSEINVPTNDLFSTNASSSYGSSLE